MAPESWVTYRHHLRLLERFHQRCLRIILKIHWSNFVTNVEVLQLAEITSIEAMLLKSQFRWAGHVSRMKDQRLPKIALYGELSTGHRDRGAPKKRYKDHLKKSLDNCHIDHHQWSTLAADREAWRGIIHQAVSSFEDTRRATLKGQTPQEEEPENFSSSSNKRKSHLHLPPLQPDLPVPHRPLQPPACPASWTWISFFFWDLRSRSQAMMMTTPPRLQGSDVGWSYAVTSGYIAGPPS